MTDEQKTVVAEEVTTPTDTPTDTPVVETPEASEAEVVATPEVVVEAEVKE